MSPKKRPVTPFDEKTRLHSPHPLGISRIRQIPPSAIIRRKDVLAVVKAGEIEAAEKAIAQHDAGEKLFRENDISALDAELRKLERESRGAADAIKIHQLRQLAPTMSPEANGAGLHSMRLARQAAADLACPIVERLLERYDALLTERALAREAEFVEAGIPLTSGTDSHGRTSYVLHDCPLLLGLQCVREMCRNRLLNFAEDGGDNFGIALCRWLVDESAPSPDFL